MRSKKETAVKYCLDALISICGLLGLILLSLPTFHFITDSKSVWEYTFSFENFGFFFAAICLLILFVHGLNLFFIDMFLFNDNYTGEKISSGREKIKAKFREIPIANRLSSLIKFTCINYTIYFAIYVTGGILYFCALNLLGIDGTGASLGGGSLSGGILLFIGLILWTINTLIQFKYDLKALEKVNEEDRKKINQDPTLE